MASNNRTPTPTRPTMHAPRTPPPHNQSHHLAPTVGQGTAGATPPQWGAVPTVPPTLDGPELFPHELVTISIDSAHLTHVISTLMKTIKSQSICLQSLQDEVKVLSDIRTRDEMTQQHIGRLGQQLQNVDDQLKAHIMGNEDSVKRLYSDVTILRDGIKAVGEDVLQHSTDIQIIKQSFQSNMSDYQGIVEELTQQRTFVNRMDEDINTIRQGVDTNFNDVHTHLQNHQSALEKQNEVKVEKSQLSDLLLNNITAIDAELRGFVHSSLQGLEQRVAEQFTSTRDLDEQRFNRLEESTSVYQGNIEKMNLFMTQTRNATEKAQNDINECHKQFGKEIQNTQVNLQTLTKHLTDVDPIISNLVHRESVSDSHYIKLSRDYDKLNGELNYVSTQVKDIKSSLSQPFVATLERRSLTPAASSTPPATVTQAMPSTPQHQQQQQIFNQQQHQQLTHHQQGMNNNSTPGMHHMNSVAGALPFTSVVTNSNNEGQAAVIPTGSPSRVTQFPPPTTTGTPQFKSPQRGRDGSLLYGMTPGVGPPQPGAQPTERELLLAGMSRSAARSSTGGRPFL